MKYILIVVFVSKFGQGEPAATSIEFSSQASCEAAKSALITASEKGSNVRAELAVCSEK